MSIYKICVDLQFRKIIERRNTCNTYTIMLNYDKLRHNFFLKKYHLKKYPAHLKIKVRHFNMQIYFTIRSCQNNGFHYS